MRRSLALGVVAVAAGVGAYALWPRRASSPEDQVRAAVRDMEQGLGSRDAARVLDQVSEAFRSQTLGDRAELRQLVLGELLRGAGLRVVTLQADVLSESDGRLRWRGLVAAARLPGPGLVLLGQGELRQFHVDAVFADEYDHWRLVDATVTAVD